MHCASSHSASTTFVLMIILGTKRVSVFKCVCTPSTTSRRTTTGCPSGLIILPSAVELHQDSTKTDTKGGNSLFGDWKHCSRSAGASPVGLLHKRDSCFPDLEGPALGPELGELASGEVTLEFLLYFPGQHRSVCLIASGLQGRVKL